MEGSGNGRESRRKEMGTERKGEREEKEGKTVVYWRRNQRHGDNTNCLVFHSRRRIKEVTGKGVYTKRNAANYRHHAPTNPPAG